MDDDSSKSTEPATGSEYPIIAGSRLDPDDNENQALAAIVTPTRITCQQNYQAFMIVLQSLSKPIQTALLTSTDMAAKGIRFLRRQYGAVAGDQEYSSFTAMQYAQVTSLPESSITGGPTQLELDAGEPTSLRALLTMMILTQHLPPMDMVSKEKKWIQVPYQGQ
eukprot:gene26760-4337_t